MTMRFITTLCVAAMAAGAWAQDETSDQLEGYNAFGVEADISSGSFDGTIDRMVGNVKITLFSDDPELEPLPISADEVTFTYGEEDKSMPERILMKGHVVIKDPSGTMKADQADWDFTTGVVVLTGNPVIDTPALSGFRGEEIRINLEEGTWEATMARVERVEFRERAGAAPDPALMHENDIPDWTAFLTAFKRQCRAEGPTPGNHILALFDPEAKTLIDAMTVEDLLGMKKDIVKRLNDALARPDFYDETAWLGRAIPDEATAGLQQAAEGDLPPRERTRTNRLLLEAAFPGQIRPQPAAPDAAPDAAP